MHFFLKNNLLKLLIVLLIFFHLFFYPKLMSKIDIMSMRTQAQKINWDNFLSRNDQVEYSVFLGDSQVQQAVNPDYLGQKVINLSISGASPLVLVSKLNQIKKVKCLFISSGYDYRVPYSDVYFELHAFNDFSSSNDIFQNYKYSYKNNFFPAAEEPVINFFLKLFFYKLKLVSLVNYEYITFFLTKGESYKNLKRIYEVMIQNRGYFESFESMKKDTQEKLIRYRNYNQGFFANRQLDSELEELTRAAIGKSDRVIYLETPILDSKVFRLFSSAYSKDKFNHVCKIFQNADHSCYKSEKIYHERHFNNPAHMNSNGATYFTEELKKQYTSCFK